jgi:multidrug efflux pump
MSDATPQKDSLNLSRWALSQKSLVIFMMIVTLVLGAWSFMRLTRNEDPPFTIKTMVVAAAWPGATATDTARLLTDKIEEKLEETPYLDRLDSYSKAGEAVVFVNLRDDTPPAKVDELWYQVRKKVNDIAPQLPDGVQGPFFDDEFGDTYGLIYGFTAEGFSSREVRDRLEAIRAQVLATPHIGKVIVLGVQEEQIVLAFSLSRLAEYGIGADELAAAIADQNAIEPSGVVRTATDNIALRVSGRIRSEDDLRDMVLWFKGKSVRLMDLVEISRKPTNPPAPIFKVNGQPALGLAISMNSTGNLETFGEAIRQKMKRIGDDLPHGIDMTVVADQSTVVKDAVKGFVKVLIEAIVIVLVVSFLSLGLRAGLVVMFSIPLVLAMTFVGMDLFDIGLQRISLGALIIALGLLVDDSMITVEAMVSGLEHGWTRERAASFAYESTAFPMLTGTLVMIAGFIPVGFAESSAGEYCFSLFMVVLISLLASWVVAILFAPILGVWMLSSSPHAAHKEGRGVAIYKRCLGWLLAHPWHVIVASVVALGISVAGATRLEEQFFPASDRPELLVDLTLPQNASLAATASEVERLEKVLTTSEDVDRVSSYVGAGAIRFYLPMDLLLAHDNVAQLVVVTKNLEARDRLRKQLDELLAREYATLTTRVMPLELGPPVGWPLKYRVTGPDPNKVYDYAQQLATVVAAHPRTVEVNLTAGEPQRSVTVNLKHAEARAVGVSAKDVASTMATVASGTSITTVWDANRKVDVVLRARGEETLDPSSLANLQIDDSRGNKISLRQIASIEYGVEQPIVWKRQRQAIITVQADVQPGVQPQTVVGELTDEIERFRTTLLPGFRVEVGGAMEEAAKGNNSILAVVPIMGLVMITLLMIQLRSFSRMALALAMAPFGLIGVVAVMLPTGTPMGFVAQLGVIALAGMIIRNAVILIDEADENVKRGMEPLQAVTHAAVHRSRPILLTALAAILGMVPIAFQVFWGPMAFAIIGGLAAGTILTLTLLPAALVMLLSREQKSLSKAALGT